MVNYSLFNHVILIKTFLIISIIFVCKGVHFIFEGGRGIGSGVIPKDNITVFFLNQFAI
ncbi:Uncharacterised protein [uncultured archaeon]|nr:Uncharacterised protein [uncultured archaeon]